MCHFYSQVLTLSAQPTLQVQQITAETLFSSDRPDPFQCTRAHARVHRDPYSRTH